MTTSKEVKNVCRQCGNEYSRKEVARIYGAESGVWGGGFCSAACFTNSKMQSQTKEVLHTQGIWEVGKSKSSSGWKIYTIDGIICETTLANAELICKAVNERQGLIDSNIELVKVMEDANKELHCRENWYDAKLILEKAISNAKSIQP